MLVLQRPNSEEISSYLKPLRAAQYSYSVVGATREGSDAYRSAIVGGYRVERRRIHLGEGAATYERACSALRNWTMFQVGFASVHPAGAPVRPGTLVVVRARVLGIWSLHPCRIVYTLDDPGPSRRFGFAYGTLPGHAARGEERFCVEWHESTGEVSYELLAISRAGEWITRVGYPLFRRAQVKFGKRSLRAMERAVSSGTPLVTQ